MTRYEILEYVKKNINKMHFGGLCWEIHKALDLYVSMLRHEDIHKVFPAFTRGNAFQFGASATDNYWWPAGQIEGRLDFLDWLIDYYKDDKTDLKTIEL